MWLCMWEVNASDFLLLVIMCSLSFINRSYICILEKKKKEKKSLSDTVYYMLPAKCLTVFITFVIL